jgi:phage shock protein PspC (stress-responsive transcriptional regulator)
MATPAKKLYKTKEGASLGGVCKGISEVYELDVSVVRILFVIITVLFTGFPLIIYFIFYLILPDKYAQKRNDNLSDDYTINQDDYKY